MLKHFEISDFHYSPKWAEFSIEQGKVVEEAARREDVDFIIVSGDFFDAPIYASNKGGIEQAKQIIRGWLSVCPVVAVEGTPSHDAPGCYSIFEEMGLALMKPGKMYGYYGYDGIRVCDQNKGYDNPYAILFGVPELSKNNIQAKLKLSGEEANAEAVKQFSRYVKEFIAPMRQKHADIPAIGVLHGNVSDSERSNETDIILKSSDIVIYTEDLRPADMTRWSLGHLHKPWESKVINCGYSGFPGMDKNPWGKRDFKPAFNLVNDGKVSRLPYSAPERRKVSSVSEIEPFSDIAWWVETKDHEEELPEGLHPWSRITYLEKQTETRRVTKEEASAVRSLWDLFKLIDPEVNEELKKKVDLITETVKHDPPGKKDVRVTKVSISGCILFKGKPVTLDFQNVSEGLNMLDGLNGDGKSSLLSFCSPYPLVIGKDTKSGRDSAIKDFFSGKDSKIQKTVILNGEKHEHLITIKAAHTKSPKTECYLTINGQPYLDKGSFDEMMKACEDLYGSFSDYRITTFCEQPQQATANFSGLMNAKPIEARNIVQAIAGVGREEEKRFSLDKAYELETELQNHLIKIETMENELADPQPLKDTICLVEDQVKDQKAIIQHTEQSWKEAREELKRITKLREAEHEKEQENIRIGKRVRDLSDEIILNEKKVRELNELAASVETNKSRIAKDNSDREEVKRIDEIEKRNFQLKTDHLRVLSDYNLQFSTATSEKEKLETELKNLNISEWKETLESWEKSVAEMVGNKKKIEEDDEALRLLTLYTSAKSAIKEKESIEREIALWNTPCEHCGKLSSESAERIKDLSGRLGVIEKTITEGPEEEPETIPTFERGSILKKIALAESAASQIAGLRENLKKASERKNDILAELDKIIIPSKPADPKYEFVPVKPSVMENREDILKDIHRGESAGEEAKTTKSLIYAKTEEALKLKADIESRTINEAVEAQHEAAEREVDRLIRQHRDESVQLERLNGQISSLLDKISAIDEKKKEIESLKAYAGTQELEDWKYIAKMLGSDKIPALELDLFLDLIDEEATDNIEPFLEGRFAFSTSTQEEGKKGKVDRFEITVIDRQTAGEQSLFTYNPGHKAFFSDAYIKALIRQRNQRMHRTYSPIIFDEADSPIKEDRIPMYYEINRKYFEKDNAKVLVVSQKKSAENYMARVININDLKE